MTIAQQKSARYGVTRICNALGVSRSTFYRKRKEVARSAPARARRRSVRRLSDGEEQAVLRILTSRHFMDKSVREVYASLLDEKIYHCSLRTMYRILKKHGAVRQRRNQQVSEDLLQDLSLGLRRTRHGQIVKGHVLYGQA